jgi:predicted ATPase
MNVPFLRSITLDSFLPFGPDAPAISVPPRNVLIGSNAPGKSNLLEVFAVLRATPADLAAAVRIGGGPAAWLWKGEHRVSAPGTAKVTAILSAHDRAAHALLKNTQVPTVSP